MVADYIFYMLEDMLPDFFMLLNGMEFTSGVSWLGLSVAVTLLSLFIGSVLMRV